MGSVQQYTSYILCSVQAVSNDLNIAYHMNVMLDWQFCLGTSSLVGQKLGLSDFKTTYSKKFREWFGYSDFSDKVTLTTEMSMTLYVSGFILMLVTFSVLKNDQKRQIGH